MERTQINEEEHQELVQADTELGWIRVAPDSKGFVVEGTGAVFVPRGFNYDHDDAGRAWRRTSLK